jgi:hypothetical protein
VLVTADSISADTMVELQARQTTTDQQKHELMIR